MFTVKEYFEVNFYNGGSRTVSSDKVSQISVMELFDLFIPGSEKTGRHALDAIKKLCKAVIATEPFRLL